MSSWIGIAANPDKDDYVYADYDFDDPGGGVTWQEITLSHDDNGNLTADGLFKYQYDAWNRLVGAWYNDGNMDDSDERVATYEYDALFRRIEKTVGNQGTGVVHGSDGSGDITGIEAGNRHEHYFYTGWRLIETTNHDTGSDYSYSDADVLNQFVYGTIYIDEPLVYDRNEDPNEDDSCLDVDGGEDADGDSSRYFYHQDANFRVVALTDESAGVVERYRYTAYGEPTVFGGENASGDELHNAVFVSSVGNPLMHQGLFRDGDIGSYHNRFRQYDAKWGRFLQRDPVGYVDFENLYLALASNPGTWLDPEGLKITIEGDDEEFKKLIECCLAKFKDDPVLGRMIQELRGSRHEHIIKQGTLNFNQPTRPGGERGSKEYNKEMERRNEASHTPGVGTGTTTSINPKRTRLSKNHPEAERDTDPCVGLIHELTHAHRADQGRRSTKSHKGVPEEEEAAIRNENRARYGIGLGQRKTYTGRPLTNPGLWPPVPKVVIPKDPPSTQPSGQGP